MTDAPDEGRLELDDAGGVVDRSGAPSALVDLADPDATDHLATSRLESWVHSTASPWLRARRRPVAAVVAVAVAVTLGSAWWASRPGPPPPPPVLTLTNAPAVGADLGGPRIGPDGHLSVAYTARVDPSYPEVDVVGITGPGLTSTGVEEGADTLTGGTLAFVQLGATITCTERAIATATPASYGIVVRTPGDLPGDDRLLAFDSSTTALDIAVRNACLASEIPRAVSVISADLTTPTGSSVVDVALHVRNDSDVPLSVTVLRTPNTTVETDLSPNVPIPAHGAATVPTRLLVHDCSTRPSPAAVTDLANPVLGPGYAVPQAQSGITLRLALGSEWTNASYPLTWSVSPARRPPRHRVRRRADRAGSARRRRRRTQHGRQLARHRHLRRPDLRHRHQARAASTSPVRPSVRARRSPRPTRSSPASGGCWRRPSSTAALGGSR